MAYLAGIDEAGYGPNLGPMTQAAVMWRLPNPNLDLWSELQDVLARDESDASKIPVADSKNLYGKSGRLASLERGLFTLLPMLRTPPLTLDSFLQDVGALGLEELRQEPWYDPQRTIPVEYPLDQIVLDVEKWDRHRMSLPSGHTMQTEWTFVAITPTPLFNRIVEKHNVKSAATAAGVISLLQKLRPEFLGQGWENVVAVDKLGGRNFYGAILQEAFPDCWIETVRETAAEGFYRVKLGCPSDLEEHDITRVDLRFMPKAEEKYLPVALASMLAKYLRELLMLQFNEYWRNKIPGLKATAGYPMDAKRFLEDIRDTLEKERIPLESVWRMK